eukprot:272136_1
MAFENRRRHSVNVGTFSPQIRQLMLSQEHDNDILHILTRTIIDINRDISLSNSFVDEEYVLLNETEIIKHWENENYDAHWLICIEKEVFVGQFTKTFNDISILTAIKLYDKLKKKILRANKNRYCMVLDDELKQKDT